MRAINELYIANNIKSLKQTIRTNFDLDGKSFPLNNAADILRAVTMINQFQFLGLKNGNNTRMVTNYFISTYKNYSLESDKFIDFLSQLSYLLECKKQIYNICDQIYEKIDLLFPAVSIDGLFIEVFYGQPF